jgi:hypothetical protein
MIDDYVHIPIDEKGRPLIPPIFKDKEREERKELMRKVKAELREKGYKIFKISRSYLDFLALKQNEALFIKVMDNKRIDEEKLRLFAEKFNVEVLIFSSNGKKRITLERKKYLTMKCSECGGKTKFYFHRPLTCSNCGRPFRHHCLWCGKEFTISSDTEWCAKCGWYKCPDGHCGCLLKPALAILSLRKRGLELSRFKIGRKSSYKITPAGIIRGG